MTKTQRSKKLSFDLEAPPHLDFFRKQLDFPWFSTSLLSTIFGFSHESIEKLRKHEKWRENSEEVPTVSGGTKIQAFYDARSMSYRTRMELVSHLVAYAEESYGSLSLFAEEAAYLGEFFNIDAPVLGAALYRSWQLQYAADASEYMELRPKDAIIAVSEGFLMPYDILQNLCSFYDSKKGESFLSMDREIRFLCAINYCTSQVGNLYPEFDFYKDRGEDDPVYYLPSRSFSTRELEGILSLSVREIERKVSKHHWIPAWFPNEQGEQAWIFLSMDGVTRSAIMQQLAFGEPDAAAPALVQ